MRLLSIKLVAPVLKGLSLINSLVIVTGLPVKTLFLSCPETDPGFEFGVHVVGFQLGSKTRVFEISLQNLALLGEPRS